MVARIRFWCTPWPSWTSEARVQPQVGDVPADRLLDDGLGGRAERRPLAPDDEPLQLGLEVEVRIGRDQVVDQLDRELAGGQPDRLVVVGVDHVVASALALHLAGLAAAHVVANRLLQLQGDVLGHVAEPGALVQPLHEPAPTAAAAGVVGQPGQPLDQRVGEAGQLVGGEVLQDAEVDHQLDGRLVVPDVRTAVDPAGDDLQVGLRESAAVLSIDRLLRRSTTDCVDLLASAQSSLTCDHAGHYSGRMEVRHRCRSGPWPTRRGGRCWTRCSLPTASRSARCVPGHPR